MSQLSAANRLRLAALVGLLLAALLASSIVAWKFGPVLPEIGAALEGTTFAFALPSHSARVSSHQPGSATLRAVAMVM